MLRADKNLSVFEREIRSVDA